MAATTTDGLREGARTARTLMHTVLGEAVAPYRETVWQESLVTALGALGVSAIAARQVVARATREGLLISERIGRRSLMHISADGLARFHEGRQRTLSFGDQPAWDERWLLVAMTIPEERREIRHRFRTQLEWLGFGSLGNGLWVSPHVEHEEEVLALLNSGEIPVGAFVCVTDRIASHTPTELARTAWDLGSLRRRYDSFVQEFSKQHPKTAEQRFGSWITMYSDWRHFPQFDPELPESLLPRQWPRGRARKLFRACDAQWSKSATEYFRSLDAQV
jgi:phenylacetic acid degradation operon negative regulatory protein